MRNLAFTSLFALLSGCGVVYHSTAIHEGVVDGGKVRVLNLTPETVLAANREPYAPQSLPAAFRSSAGTQSAGLADLPAPAYLPQHRPTSLQTKLPPPVPPTPYRIGVGDVILLSTKSPATTVAELSGLLAANNSRQGYTVQDDGSIAIPDVGRVRIGGMTLDEAESTVFRTLAERQIDPSFSLEIAEFNAHRVSIGGAVVNPGVAPITLIPLRLDAALAAVGGINAADRESAVIRIYRDGTLYQIPAEEFLTNPNYQNIRLTGGDSVFVDAEYDIEKAQAYFTEQIALSQARQSEKTSAVGLLRAQLQEERDNFSTRLELGAEKRDYVYLSGELTKPSRWPLPFEQKASLADALFEGGGVKSAQGNPRQIYVLRGSSDPREFGAISAWHLDAGNATGLMLATKFELRPDDVIFVAEQPVTRWNRVIQQITPSIITVPLDNVTSN